MLGHAILVHTGYVLICVTVGFFLGLLLGVALARTPRISGIVLPVISVFQTIPGLVFIGLLFLWLGMVPMTVIIALSIYAMFPVLKNTYTGLLGVEKKYLEAARGCGMSQLQSLLRVELPLAMPTIIAGLRMSAIYTVSWAVLAAMIGLGGLGNFVYQGTSSNNNTLILLGAIPSALLAVVIGALVDLLQKRVTPQGLRKEGRLMSWNLVLEHLFIVLAASLLSILVGVPLGIWAYVSSKVRPVILRIVDLLQTIPSLALLGIVMVFLGAGKITVITGITLYSLLPIVRNTCLGLQQVDPGVKEAARGMGMSKPYRILMVEFPLAIPTVFTGVRIAVVNAIGTAVFAAFVGGGGLGGIINRGIRIQDMRLILTGTGCLMVIAVLADSLLGWLERQAHRSRGGSRKMWIPVAGLLVCFLLLLPYGRTFSGDLSLYDGDYSETQLMHHMVKMLVEEQTGLSVSIGDQMSQVNNFKAMVGRQSHLRPYDLL